MSLEFHKDVCLLFLFLAGQFSIQIHQQETIELITRHFVLTLKLKSTTYHFCSIQRVTNLQPLRWLEGFTVPHFLNHSTVQLGWVQENSTLVNRIKKIIYRIHRWLTWRSDNNWMDTKWEATSFLTNPVLQHSQVWSIWATPTWGSGKEVGWCRRLVPVTVSPNDAFRN